MEKKFSELTIHQKLELIIKEMVDREVQFKEAVKEFEKIFIETASRKYKGNKTKTAEAMGIHRNTLQSRAKALKIKRIS
ncbi:MAG: helix-turn-helix domain-containing protein [Clostridiales bacterium]|nr:helix-turn-helix domain-containing protein [Clostridiales bacterium]